MAEILSKISPKHKGVLCIISSAFCFAFMGAFVRLAGDLPSVQKSFFRNFIALIIAFIVLIRTDEKFKFNKKNSERRIVCMPAQWTSRIIAVMHMQSISKKELAHKLGYTPEWVGKVLNG